MSVNTMHALSPGLDRSRKGGELTGFCSALAMAFSMEVGTISGIVQAGTDFHILKLHKRIPPTAVKYETVEAKLRQELQQEQIEVLQARILSELRRRANVEYVAPVLRRATSRPGQP